MPISDFRFWILDVNKENILINILPLCPRCWILDDGLHKGTNLNVIEKRASRIEYQASSAAMMASALTTLAATFEPPLRPTLDING